MEPSPKHPNVYRPKVSDISEDDQSDLEKLNSPKLVDQMKQAQVCIPKLMRSPSSTSSKATKSPVLSKSKSPVPKGKNPMPTKQPKGQGPKPISPVPNLPNMKCSVRVRKLPSPKEKIDIFDQLIASTNVNLSKKSGNNMIENDRKRSTKLFEEKLNDTPIAADANPSKKSGSKMIEKDRKGSKLVEEKVTIGASSVNTPVSTNLNASKNLGSKEIENDRNRSKLEEIDREIKKNERKRSKLVEEKVTIASSPAVDITSAPIATKVKTSKKRSKVIENNQKRSKSRENQQIGDQQLNAMTAADDSIPANVPKTTATNFTEKTGDLSKPEFSVKSVDKVNKEQSPPTTVVQPEKKKKKRKTNKTGFPVLKKKRKLKIVVPETEDDTLRPKEISGKSVDNNKVNKQQQQQPNRNVNKRPKKQIKPVRVSARIITLEEEKKAISDSDSRPSSRLSLGENANAKMRPESPLVATTSINSEKSAQKRPKSPTISAETSVSAIIPPKRSKLYEDVDENIDCLAVLPASGMESGPCSEATSEVDEKTSNEKSSGNRKRKRGSQLFKKNYLIAGLFSNFYKEQPASGSSQPPTPVSRLKYNSEEHIHGLLPPPYYCGRQLRQKKEDFSLPFDLWWQHVNKQLPGRDIAATWNYKRIKNNVYIDIPKNVAKGYEMATCHCTIPSSDQMPGIKYIYFFQFFPFPILSNSKVTQN